MGPFLVISPANCIHIFIGNAPIAQGQHRPECFLSRCISTGEGLADTWLILDWKSMKMLALVIIIHTAAFFLPVLFIAKGSIIEMTTNKVPTEQSARNVKTQSQPR